MAAASWLAKRADGGFTLAHNRYSVAAHAVGRPVEIRAYADRIELRLAVVFAELRRDLVQRHADVLVEGVDRIGRGQEQVAGEHVEAAVDDVMRVGAIHPDLQICADGIPGHSPAFRDAAAEPAADEATLLAAIPVMAAVEPLTTSTLLIRSAGNS